MHVAWASCLTLGYRRPRDADRIHRAQVERRHCLDKRESETSCDNTGADAQTEDTTSSIDLGGDTSTSEADRSLPTAQETDMPTLEVAVECEAMDGSTGKPFQTRSQSVILRTKKRQGSKFRHFSTDWYIQELLLVGSVCYYVKSLLVFLSVLRQKWSVVGPC